MFHSFVKNKSNINAITFSWSLGFNRYSPLTVAVADDDADFHF